MFSKNHFHLTQSTYFVIAPVTVGNTMKAALFVILVNKRDKLVIIQPRVFVIYVKNLKYNVQKQSYIGVLRKRYSENMQQIYRIPMPKWE